jgi:hypothetical protein
MPQKPDGTKFKSWGLHWMISRSRVAKYKQRRELFTRGFDEKYPKLAIGACTALSTAWIKAHRAHPAQQPVERVSSFNSDSSFAEHNSVATTFNDKTPGTTYGARIANFSVGAFGANAETVAGQTHTQNSLDEFTALLTFLDANPGYYMVMMEITNNKTGHVCALHATAKSMRLFDPNFGEFERSNGDRGGFFVRLKEQYEDYVGLDGKPKKLEFKKGWVFARVC